MDPRSFPLTPRWIALAGALGAVALAGLGPASCTLDTEGQHPASTSGPGSGGGGGGTSSSSTTTSETTGGGQGGAGGGQNEDCFDGVDNDGDSNADCADSDCDPTAECVDTPPGGWTGNLRVHRVAFQSPPSPTCSDGSEPTTYFVGPADPANCAMCDCNYTGASCTTPEVSCYFDVIDCSGGADLVIPAGTAGCDGNPATPGSNVGSCEYSAPSQVSNPGTCSATGGEITNPATWAEELRVCPGPAQIGGGCDTGKVCVPKAPQGFDAMVCIGKSGHDGCPGDWTYSEAQAYTGANDTRDCTSCTCDAATVTCSGGSARTYDSDNCPMFSGVDMVAPCEDESNFIDQGTFSIRTFQGMPNPGECPPSTPTGNLQTSGEMKFCCQQLVP